MSRIVTEAAKAVGFKNKLPTGRRLEEQPAAMTMPTIAKNIGPASTTPDRSTPIGSLQVYKIEAPPEDPNREKKSIWDSDSWPAWMIAGGWRQ